MRMKTQKFSLLELIICLGILAVLASILLENFADVKARECEQITYERGNHVRDIVKGAKNSDGISDFLSDMGRFPKVYIPSDGDGDGGRRLAELYDPSIWYHSTSANAMQKQKTVSSAEIQDICRSVTGSTIPEGELSFPEVNMSVGWNGPYINIANPIKGKFFDGWGNAWKIISDYHFETTSNQLVPDSTIYSEPSTPCRIDGIASFGANDTAETAEAAAADADQYFMFPHNMDNHGSENLASLTLNLKIRDTESGKWINLPPISVWKANTVYSKGDIAAANGNMYCCLNSHTSGTTFAAANWQNINSAAAYSPAVHGVGTFSGLCIYENTYYLRSSTSAESEFTPANWRRIANIGEIFDNISLFIFTPVMQNYDGNRVMQLGYYHFFRNKSSENAHGVKPVYGVGGSEDIDCTGDTTTVYSAGDDYNARYLIAEDHSSSNWNEFYIKRLTAGRRKIFCIIYNSNTQSCYQSQVEVLPLKNGNNFVTLCLERKH